MNRRSLGSLGIIAKTHYVKKILYFIHSEMILKNYNVTVLTKKKPTYRDLGWYPDLDTGILIVS